MEIIGGFKVQQLAEICIKCQPDFLLLNDEERHALIGEATVWLMLVNKVILDFGVVYPYPTSGDRFDVLVSFLAINKTRFEGADWIGGKQDASLWMEAIHEKLNRCVEIERAGLPEPLSLNEEAGVFYVGSSQTTFSAGVSVNLVVVGDRASEYQLGEYDLFSITEGVKIGRVSVSKVVLTTLNSLPQDFSWGACGTLTRDECKIRNKFPDNTDPVLTVVTLMGV